MEAAAQQLNGMGRDRTIATVLNNAEFQDLGGINEEDDAAAELDDLPIGIFPEAHPESCYHALRHHDLACTRLNAELFYEMNQLGRNRFGCSTEELGEIDLWDQLSGASIWDEPLGRPEGRLLTPEEQQENLTREVRWRHVERFLQEVYGWCRDNRAPGIVPYHNRKGRSTWRSGSSGGPKMGYSRVTPWSSRSPLALRRFCRPPGTSCSGVAGAGCRPARERCGSRNTACI